MQELDPFFNAGNMDMTLEDFGYSDHLESERIALSRDGFEMGRICSEHKERYHVMTSRGELEAEITGNLRFTAKSREDFPCVGDWVAIVIYERDFAIIHKVLPRSSVISRQAVDQPGESQIIAANVDFAFLVQAIDRDYSINRLERYLAICNDSGIKPVILLSKTDLLDESRIREIENEVKDRIQDAPVIAMSNETQRGYDEIKSLIRKGKTYCMLGSSGVGKSTLMNNLIGASVMKTNEISSHTSRGKHITSYRQLVLLDNGGILIDNPGMREVGIADATDGFELTFEKIVRLSMGCRFKDCTHTNETGCSVIEGVEKGIINTASYENYLKMRREIAHFETTAYEKRKHERKFGKILKNYKKDMKKNQL